MAITFSCSAKKIKRFIHWQTESESRNDRLPANKLSLRIKNERDTKYTLCSPKEYPDIDTLPKLHIANRLVFYTSLIEYLCIYLDYELSFKEHRGKIYIKLTIISEFFILIVSN